MTSNPTYPPPVYNSISSNQENDDEDNPDYYFSNDPPPAYFEVVRSTGTLASRLISIICGSVLLTVLLVFFLTYPLGTFYIGFIYKGQCPIEPRIPIWLMIMGIVGTEVVTLKFLINLIACHKYNTTRRPDDWDCCLFCKTHDNDSVGFRILKLFATVSTMILFAWFLVGNYFVYSVYNRVQIVNDHKSENFCNSVCYLFAFYSITITWALGGMMCACLCCMAGAVTLASSLLVWFRNRHYNPRRVN